MRVVLFGSGGGTLYGLGQDWGCRYMIGLLVYAMLYLDIYAGVHTAVIDGLKVILMDCFCLKVHPSKNFVFTILFKSA